MSELILINANFYTQDPFRPQVRAVAISGGRIMAVGDSDEIKSLARPGADVIDLGGRLVLPGLTDCHIHYIDWSLSRRRLALAEVGSLNEVLERLAVAAQKTAHRTWIIGQGLDESHWDKRRLPTRDDLDVATSLHPVLLWRRDMHLAVANSMALELAGVNESTPNPPGGVVVRDRVGRPTGVLKDQAIDLANNIAPEPTDDEILEAMRDTMPTIHSLGLTGIHDMRNWHGSEGALAFRAWCRLHESGKLDLRCWMNLSGERLDEIIALGLRTGFGNDYLRIGHLKYFADGSIGAQTAWVLENYQNGDYGMRVCSMADLTEAIGKADEAGLAVAIHAIGDKANREIITIFEDLKKRRAAREMEANSRPNVHHRIEHAQMIRPEDLARLARLDVIASVQPLHITDDMAIYNQETGGNWAFTFRDMINAGVKLIFGSDCPVSNPNPMWGIHAAVTRRRRNGQPTEGWYPHQQITVAEALWGYTMGPALACGSEDELGSITPGKYADLTVLDRDIFAIDPMEIAETKVDLTVFNGRIVFER